MSLADFFTPINLTDFEPENGYHATQFGNIVQVYQNTFPDIENGDIAIFGVMEDRGSKENYGCAKGADEIRKKFYTLFQSNSQSKIIDLGNIAEGFTLNDTYVAIKTVVAELIQNNVLPIIIGGSHDLTYGQYLAYENLEQKVDLVVVDSHFDLDQNIVDNADITSTSYLNNIFLHQPNYLFNYSNLAYQTYFVSQDSLKVMEKLFFDAIRLGDISHKIEDTEPTIRNANMLSFDIGSIRSSDAMANAMAKPNGLFGNEACKICHYAGYSDKLNSIGFYEYNPNYDINGQTASLISQMIWYFIDGFYNRKNDIPAYHKLEYTTYKTTLKEDIHEIVFIKSTKTGRWWMQVPYPNNGSKNERYHLVPCLYKDYETATKGEMPDIWWRTFQKLI